MKDFKYYLKLLVSIMMRIELVVKFKINSFFWMLRVPEQTNAKTISHAK